MKLYMAVVEENGCVRAHDFIKSEATDKIALLKHIFVSACSGELDLTAPVIQERIKEVNDLWVKLELQQHNITYAILKLQSLVDEAEDADDEQLEEDVMCLIGDGVTDDVREYLSNLHELLLGVVDKLEEVSETQTLLLAVVERD